AFHQLDRQTRERSGEAWVRQGAELFHEDSGTGVSPVHRGWFCLDERARRPFHFGHVHFTPLPLHNLHAVDRQRVEKLVREHAAGDPFGQRIADFHHLVRQLRRGGEHVGAQLAALAAELHHGKVTWLTELLAEPAELAGEDLAEQRTDADAGEIVALFADAWRPAAVLAVRG